MSAVAHRPGQSANPALRRPRHERRAHGRARSPLGHLVCRWDLGAPHISPKRTAHVASDGARAREGGLSHIRRAHSIARGPRPGAAPTRRRPLASRRQAAVKFAKNTRAPRHSAGRIVIGILCNIPLCPRGGPVARAPSNECGVADAHRPQYEPPSKEVQAFMELTQRRVLERRRQRECLASAPAQDTLQSTRAAEEARIMCAARPSKACN